jgi:hypothetical protein
MTPLKRAAFASAFFAICGIAAASAQSACADLPAAEIDPKTKALIQAMAAMAETDPELANHFGIFKSRPVSLEGYGGKLVVAANIITTITGTRTSPADLNALASKEKLYSENAYGADVVLDPKAMCRLLSLASKGRFAVSLAYRVEGGVPVDEAQEALSSSDLFVILAYLDHTPMIENGFSWNPDGSIARVRVVNPLAAAGGAAPYKAKSEYDPKAFDAWEFYRFKKTIR